mmetsp:Transcript_28115/g.47684  ORF Transcript_28115/g.47684 Transcript_28115/m.47684 type:complete len:109 (+) Transcript_28115:56-382(+)
MGCTLGGGKLQRVSSLFFNRQICNVCSSCCTEKAQIERILPLALFLCRACCAADDTAKHSTANGDDDKHDGSLYVCSEPVELGSAMDASFSPIIESDGSLKAPWVASC